MRALNNLLKTFSMARPALWIGAPLSMTVGLAFYVATAASIEEDARGRFASYTQTAGNTIAARIKSYTDVLRGTVSLFQISEPLTRMQFNGYVTGLELENNFPAIENINFSSYLQHAQREDYEQRMRSEYLTSGANIPDFAITPPGTRDVYCVITYLEPEKTRWISTLGFDMCHRPAVRQTLEAMRDSGKMVTSGKPISLVSNSKHTVLGLRLPVYRPHHPIASVEQRRSAYLGSVGIAFSVQRLVKGVIDEFPIQNVHMKLVDNMLDTPQRKPSVLLDDVATSSQAPHAPWLQARRFSATLPIDFNGRQWDATFSVAAREMYSGFEQYIPWLAMLAGFVSTMLLYALFHTLTSSRRRAIKLAKGMTRELRDSQAKLQLSHQNLRRLAAHADQIKEGERKRIAREIHDDLGQNLLALRIEADMLSSRTGERHPRLHARARSTLAQIDATIKSVRQIINDLRPNVLDLGLSAAVEWQVAEFVRRTGIACELVDEPAEVELSDNAATAFFRILQESLSNIVRHANASRVRIELKSNGTRLTMTVSDNGVGLHVHERNKVGSFGLVGIEERINILGGTFSITSAEDKGTTVCVSAPLHADAPRPAATSRNDPKESHAVLV